MPQRRDDETTDDTDYRGRCSRGGDCFRRTAIRAGACGPGRRDRDVRGREAVPGVQELQILRALLEERRQVRDVRDFGSRPLTQSDPAMG